MISPSSQNQVIAKQGLEPKSLFCHLIPFPLADDRRERQARVLTMPRGNTDLNVSPGCLHILLVGGVSGLSPVTADGDGNHATLPGAVHIIVQMPGLSMSL